MENLDDGGIGGEQEVGLLMANINIKEKEEKAQEPEQGLAIEEGQGGQEGDEGTPAVDTGDESEVEDDAVEVTDKGDLVLVQYNKYKWPGRVARREGNQVYVQLFDKRGLKLGLSLKLGLRVVHQDAVTDFVFSDELAGVVNSSNNHELKNGFNKALMYLRK